MRVQIRFSMLAVAAAAAVFLLISAGVAMRLNMSPQTVAEEGSDQQREAQEARAAVEGAAQVEFHVVVDRRVFEGCGAARDARRRDPGATRAGDGQ